MRGRLRRRRRRLLRPPLLPEPSYRCLHCRRFVHAPDCILLLVQRRGGAAGGS